MIYKVIVEEKDPDTMEEINHINNKWAFNTENWCDKYEFEEYPKLNNYILKENIDLLNTGAADYIIFKLE